MACRLKNALQLSCRIHWNAAGTAVKPLRSRQGLTVKRYRPECLELCLDCKLVAGLLVAGLSCPVGQLGDQWRHIWARGGGGYVLDGEHAAGNRCQPGRRSREGRRSLIGGSLTGASPAD